MGAIHHNDFGGQSQYRFVPRQNEQGVFKGGRSHCDHRCEECGVRRLPIGYNGRNSLPKSRTGMKITTWISVRIEKTPPSGSKKNRTGINKVAARIKKESYRDQKESRRDQKRTDCSGVGWKEREKIGGIFKWLYRISVENRYCFTKH